MRALFLLWACLLFTAAASVAQSNKALAEAEKFYSVKAYDQALPKYLEAIQAGEKSAAVQYKVGVCYQKTGDLNEQIKAIPYFETALQDKAMPVSLNYDLGTLYLLDENLQKAIESFTKYRNLSNKADKKAIAQADEAIQTCHNAVALMSVPRDFNVHHFNSIINTKYTEYNPVVSADESVMAFTALRPNTGKTRTGDKFIEEIYTSTNSAGSWSEPKVIPWRTITT